MYRAFLYTTLATELAQVPAVEVSASGSGMQGAPMEGNLERVAGNHSRGISGVDILKGVGTPHCHAPRCGSSWQHWHCLPPGVVAFSYVLCTANFSTPYSAVGTSLCRTAEQGAFETVHFLAWHPPLLSSLHFTLPLCLKLPSCMM